MSELIRSGRSVSDALAVVAASRAPAIKSAAEAMRTSTGDGSAESFFAAAGPGFGPLDREVVRGGESSGQLDQAMAYLETYYASLVRARRRVLTGSLYPFFLLHFGALTLAIPALFSGGMRDFVAQAAGFLAIFYVLFALGWFGFRAVVRAAAVNPAVDRMLQSLPAVGATRVALVGSRFCLIMGMLVKASGGILSAIRRSAGASGSALFERGAGQAVTAVQAGQALGAAIAGTRAFPEGIDRAFQIGETSGRLDEEMTRQSRRFSEQFDRRINLLSGALTKVIVLAVMLALAWKIIAFYSGYLQGLNSLMQ